MNLNIVILQKNNKNANFLKKNLSEQRNKQMNLNDSSNDTKYGQSEFRLRIASTTHPKGEILGETRCIFFDSLYLSFA